MKKIALFITSLKIGGAERVVVNLSHAFIKSGKYDVSFILLEGDRDYNLPEGTEVAVFNKKSLNSILQRIASLVRDSFKLKRFIQSEGIDIVLSFMQRPNTINMLAKMLGAGQASCVSVRICLKKQYEDTPIFIKFVSRIILKWLWHYADRTIVNSSIIKNEIISLFSIRPETIDIIYNPLNIENIRRQSKEEIFEEWYNQKEIPIIINVGRLTKQKGHVYLLKAIALVAESQPVRLVIIGDGELKSSLIYEATSLGIAGKVLFMGWQKNPYKYISRSNVFVLSSLWEGFPNVVLEAMACCCPVVVSDCLSGPSEILLPQENDKRDIVKTNYGMLVNDPNEISLSKAIEYILKNSDVAKRYAEAGLRRASQFNLSSIVKDYENALSRTLKRDRDRKM